MPTVALGSANELAVCCSAGFGPLGRPAACAPCHPGSGPVTTPPLGMGRVSRLTTACQLPHTTARARWPNKKLSSRRAAKCDGRHQTRWGARMSRRSAGATGSAPRRVPARYATRGPTPPRSRPRSRTGRHPPRSRCRGCLSSGRRTSSSAAAPARVSCGHEKPIGGGRLLQRRVRR
jgi:hypothetical protein